MKYNVCIFFLLTISNLPSGILPKSVLGLHTCKRIDFFHSYHVKKNNYELYSRTNNYKVRSWQQKKQTEAEGLKSIKSKMANDSVYRGLYRPRSALARALYEKQINDRYLQEFDQNEWYKVDSNRLDAEMQQKFVQLSPDEETKEFLAKSIDKSSWVWTQIWYLLAKAVLRHFWSITDVNGWLGRGCMFVLSHAQAKTLLHQGREAQGLQSIVDIGAGDGEVSRRLASLYTDRYATEISSKMRNVLSSKGYKLLDTERWWQSQQFDCICMLNLLDRCSRPITMLREASAAMTKDGILVVALVLPYKPYVEVNPDHKPEEMIPISGAYFEDQASSFVSFMKQELGFELVSWTRVPYFCEGDFAQAYYWLDDSVYVFNKATKLE